jgi:hypothetical protein
MEEIKETKKEWAMPEIFDLDVEKTTSGDINPIEFSSTAGPS